MAKIEILVPFIKSWEGGWSESLYDKGGATMCGITLKTFTEWRTGQGLPAPTKQDLHDITDEEWLRIMRIKYWNRLRADQIESQAVANMAVDWCWCSGSPAVRALQRLCGTTVDGIVGPKTIAAVNSCDPEQLFRKLKEARKEFLQRIVDNDPVQERHLGGWLRRVNSIQYDKLTLNR